jgi:hypothetical protein
MASARSGFTQTIQGLTIVKDTEAQLIYTFDWSQWLADGDTLSETVYTVSARANDPDPLIIETQGVQGDLTYVELSNGQEGKVYTVTCKVTTANELIDRRNFRVKVQARSA